MPGCPESVWPGRGPAGISQQQMGACGASVPHPPFSVQAENSLWWLYLRFRPGRPAKGQPLAGILPGEGGSELSHHPGARGKARMKSPEARTSRETHKRQDRDAVAEAVAPWSCSVAPWGWLGALGATDRGLRSHFRVRRERPEPPLQFHQARGHGLGRGGGALRARAATQAQVRVSRTPASS